MKVNIMVTLEDKRRIDLDKLSGIKFVNNDTMKIIQSYYDENHSLRECQEKFGFCRSTLIKYLTTRSRTKLHENQKKKRNSERVVSWRQRVKQKLVEYKGGTCCFCGYKKCNRNLHFHHKDPSQKEFNITGQTKSFERLQKEVDKCILVCSNCHGEIHEGIIFIPE